MRKLQVKIIVIDANNHIRLALDRELQQMIKTSPSFQISFWRGDPDDRMFNEIEREFHTCRRHAWTARAEKRGSNPVCSGCESAV